MTRKRINDAARAVLATHAVGADLDNLAALPRCNPSSCDGGRPERGPSGIEEVLETDTRLRDRLLNTLESVVPGSQAWYRTYALRGERGGERGGYPED